MNGRWQLVGLVVMGLVLAFVAGLGLAQGSGPQVALGGAPTVVSYQGRVTVGGSAYEGTGHFKFAIVDAAGTTSYWSNDGTSTGGGEPTNGTSLPVANGLFNVLLGDTSLTNMTQPLDAAVFGGSQRYLRVWFSEDYIAYQQLSPDGRIAAVPYALQAQEAANADTVDGHEASAFAGAGHDHDGLLPAGALVLGRTDTETTLIDAGFSYSGRKLFNTWNTMAPMLTARDSLAAAVVDGVVYAIGGWDGSDYLRTNEAYDPATDSWSTKEPMPTARYGLAAAVVDGVVYAIGGRVDGDTLEANEAYDPATDSWSTKAPMPTPRNELVAVAVDGVVYAIGGTGSSADPQTNEAYDPADNSWSTKKPMPTVRSEMAAAVVDGVVYVIGGANRANEAYDPTNDSWSTKEPMPANRYSLAAAVVDGVVYAVGGNSPPDWRVPTNEAYDPATDSWSPRAAMPTGRQGLAAVAVDGVIYAIGGYDGGWLKVNEAYTPALYVYRKE